MRTQALVASLLLLTAASFINAATMPRPQVPAATSVMPATVADLDWMTGRWVREEPNAYLEETWSTPVNNSLTGMFRWNCNGKPWMCELMTITQEGDKTLFRLRHFDATLKPWEKETPLTYSMVKLSESEVVFEDPHNAADHPRRFIYKRAGDALTVRLENADGSGDEFTFTLAKHDASASAAKSQAAGASNAGSPIGFTGGLVLRFTVTDRAKSRNWYRDMLGFEVLFEVDEIGWTEMNCEAAKLTIGLAESKAVSVSTGTMPVIGVADLDRARKHLESKGVKFTGETIEHAGLVRLATLLDPDGHQIMLYQALGD